MMFDVIGWIVLIAPLIWASIATYFLTVPTFGDALFTGTHLHKIIGVIAWLIVIAAWVWWLSFIEVKV